MFVHNATLINLTYFRRLIVKAHFNIYVVIVVVHWNVQTIENIPFHDSYNNGESLLLPKMYFATYCWIYYTK